MGPGPSGVSGAWRSRCGSPLRPVGARHLDGCGDRGLGGQVVGVAEREEDVLQLPRLEEARLGQPRVEIADGWEELPGVHGTQPLPRTSSRAALSAMPSPTSLRMRCRCSRVALSPGPRSEESTAGASTEVTEELKLFFPFSREDLFSGRL